MIAVATEISKAINSTKVIGMFLGSPERPRPVFWGIAGRGLGLCARVVEPGSEVTAIRYLRG
jgi:hypothetical protein